VRAKKSKAIIYDFRFRKLNQTPPLEVARGSLTVVCVTHQGKGKMAAVTIPPTISEKIDPAPPSLL
jgi:hypothetical protein